MNFAINFFPFLDEDMDMLNCSEGFCYSLQIYKDTTIVDMNIHPIIPRDFVTISEHEITEHFYKYWMEGKVMMDLFLFYIEDKNVIQFDKVILSWWQGCCVDLAQVYWGVSQSTGHISLLARSWHFIHG